jgi:hypothetical protein
MVIKKNKNTQFWHIITVIKNQNTQFWHNEDSQVLKKNQIIAQKIASSSMKIDGSLIFISYTWNWWFFNFGFQNNTLDW